MLFNEKCTIFHFDTNDNLIKYNFNNCYYHKSNSEVLSKVAEDRSNVKVLILYNENLLQVKVGDLIVLDEVIESYGQDYTLERNIRTDYETFTIQAIEECMQGSVKHYMLTCK